MLEATIGFGDQDDMLSRKKPSLCHDCAIVVSLLVIDIALAMAGVIITILDRSQITKMKQFDDIGDLI
jgi:hypothetical protein